MDTFCEIVADAKCCHCGKIEQVRIIPALSGILDNFVCDACKPHAEAEAEQQRRERAKARTRARFAEISKDYAEFLQPIDRALLRNPEAFDQVQRWRPNSPGQDKLGLVIAASSGVGKTRAVMALLRSLMCEEGIDCEFVRSADFASDAVSATRDGWLGRLLRPLVSVPVLFMDDLGKGQRSQSVGEALQSVIEARCNRRLPIIVTTQYDGKTLSSLYSPENPELGAAFARRIREFCEQIPFSNRNKAE